MVSFNLIDKPWIPVERRHGERPGTVERISIRDALCHANDVAAIRHQSPLAVGALYRLLGGILQRALVTYTTRPDNHVERCAEWFLNGWPVAEVESYLATWYDSFDLFSESKPFLQVPGLWDEKWLDSWTRLTADLGSGNTNFLYNASKRYIPSSDAAPISAADAAVLLIEHQQFGLGGLIKRLVTSVQAAPLASSAVFLPVGASLRESLVLQMFDNRVNAAGDLPCWEQSWWPLTQNTLESQVEKVAPGPIATITWPLRAIRLLPERDGDSLTVRSMVYAAGLPLANSEERGKQDDMVAQRVTADKRVLPLRFSESKSIWRNVEAFLPLVKYKEATQATRIPPVVKHALAVWATMREISREHVRGLRVVGQINDKSKVDLVVDSAFVLGPAALDAERHGQGILDVVNTAEDIGSALSVAGYILAKNLLKYDEQSADPDAARRLARSIGADREFWATMDQLFYAYLARAEGEDDKVAMIESMHDAARQSWQTTVQQVGRNARNLKAIAQAERKFLHDMYHILKPFREYAE